MSGNLSVRDKDEISSRLARALTDSFNRTNEIPSEQDLKESIGYILDTLPIELEKSK